MAKFILIKQNDYKYVVYPNYDKVHEALNSYLLSNFDITDFICDYDGTIKIDNKTILHCCKGDTIEVNGNEYDSDFEMDDIIRNEFGGSADDFITWLTENGYLVLDTQEFDDEFKDFMWDVVFYITSGKLSISIDYDDLFVSVHGDYGIDTAIDCVKELLD